MQNLDSEVRYAWIQNLCPVISWFSASLVFSKLFWLQSTSVSLGQCIIILKSKVFSHYPASILPTTIQTDQTSQIRSKKLPHNQEPRVLKRGINSPLYFPLGNSRNFPICAIENTFLPSRNFCVCNLPSLYQPLQSAATWPGPSFIRLPQEKMWFSQWMPWQCVMPQASLPFRKTQEGASDPGHL